MQFYVEFEGIDKSNGAFYVANALIFSSAKCHVDCEHELFLGGFHLLHYLLNIGEKKSVIHKTSAT